MRFLGARTFAVLSIGATLCAGTAASAATLMNGGFETGDTTGWTSSDAPSTDAATSLGSFNPIEGFYLGYAGGDVQDVPVTLSQTVTLAAGDTLSGYWGFQADDVYQDTDPSDVEYGTILNDDASLGLILPNAVTNQLEYSNVLMTGDFGATGWQYFSYVVPMGGDGDYTLVLSSTNHGDSFYPSFAVLDDVTVTPAASPTPEPETWVMLLAGFGVVGGSMRTARRARAAVVGAR